MELSNSEIAIIAAHRAEEAAKLAAHAFQRKAIATAYAFAEWSEKSGYDLTFSTFVNQFDYQEDDGKQMYDAVARIQKAAWPA